MHNVLDSFLPVAHVHESLRQESTWPARLPATISQSRAFFLSVRLMYSARRVTERATFNLTSLANSSENRKELRVHPRVVPLRRECEIAGAHVPRARLVALVEANGDSPTGFRQRSLFANRKYSSVSVFACRR